MPPVGFEPTISAGERPKTYVLYRAATGTATEILPTWSYKQDMFKYLTPTISATDLSPVSSDWLMGRNVEGSDRRPI